MAGASRLTPGSVLGGKYRLVRKVGAGGMCDVFEAEHLHLQQIVALKLLKPMLAFDPESVTRFTREAQAAARLRSIHVARVFDIDHLPTGEPFITMDLLVGHDLATELERRGCLPIIEAVDYVSQAAEGVAEAHALRIVHRDLKPSNLFLSSLGLLTNRRLVKILDFGIARLPCGHERRLTAPNSVFGTVDYMSPEHVQGAASADTRSDVWALGIILYELLTGRTPFTGSVPMIVAQIVRDPVTPPNTWKPELPRELVAVVMRALHKNPSERYQTVEELRAALLPFLGGIEPIGRIVANLPPLSVPRNNQPSARHVETLPNLATGTSFEVLVPQRPRRRQRLMTLALLAGVATLGVGHFFWSIASGTSRSAAGSDLRVENAPPPSVLVIADEESSLVIAPNVVPLDHTDSREVPPRPAPPTDRNAKADPRRAQSPVPDIAVAQARSKRFGVDIRGHGSRRPAKAR